MMEREVVYSLVHSVMCIPLCLHGLWEADWMGLSSGLPTELTVAEFWWRTTPATTRCVIFSALYFLWDLFHEFRKKDGRTDNRFHAFMGATAYAVVGLWLAQGHTLLCLSLVNEISTPFYNAFRIISHRLKLAKEATLRASLEQDRAYAGKVFATAFFIVRVAFMPIYLWCRIRPFIIAGLAMPKCRVPAAIAAFELSLSTALNLFWFILILKAAIRNKTRSSNPSA